MKKVLAILFMLLMFCVSALAAAADMSETAPDYQTLLGGSNAVVELTDRNIVAATANLKVYPKLNAVRLPDGLKNYKVIRAGKEQAFLIIPHYKRTRVTVRKTVTRKEEGALKGELEGRSLVLFCDKGASIIELLIRNGHGIQLVSFVPDAAELQPDGQPGDMIIPERKQRFLKDITQQIRHDGDIVQVE